MKKADETCRLEFQSKKSRFNTTRLEFALVILNPALNTDSYRYRTQTVFRGLTRSRTWILGFGDLRTIHCTMRPMSKCKLIRKKSGRKIEMRSRD